MKKHTSIWGRTAFALTLLFLVFLRESGSAQPFESVGGDSISNDWWFNSIQITSRAYPTLLNCTNFDDWRHAQTIGTDTIYFNCQRQWMFTGYTSPDDSFDVVLDRNISYAPDYFDIYVYKDYPSPDTTPFATYINEHITSPFLFKSADPGLYIFKVLPHGATADTSVIMVEYLMLLPKIKKMWIEADPICAGTYASGTNYNFRVKSDPDLSGIWDYPISLGSILSFPVPSWPAAPGSILCENTFAPWDFRMEITVSDIPGNDLKDPSNPVTGEERYFNLNNRFGVDLTDYQIEHLDLADWVSSSGGFYGVNPIINVDFVDHIGVHYELSAPIIVKAPATSIPPSVNPTATTPIYFNGPANAVGIPSTSFDVYDYNVVGNETWTPTSNPFASMAGQGSTVSTIRVQHRLNIPAGASLTLKGMRLEFAPGATAFIDKATTSSGNGGLFNVIEGSVLTAYRGCNGTDNVSWGGVRVQGSTASIPLTAGGGLDFWNMSHAKLNIRNSTISYAATGILCNGGAGVIAYNSNFLNNQTSLVAGPYHNVIGGVEYNCVLSMANCQVIVDTDGPFGVYNYITLNDNKGFWANNNTFKNLSGAVIQYCIVAYDAGLNLENNEFYDFSTAVSSSYLWGTTVTRTVGNTFNKNWTGLDLIGGVSPLITENNFNIPSNPPTTSAMYYPGTSVLMLSSHNIGALMRSTTGYNIVENNFRKYVTGPPLVSSVAPADYITGTLEYNTGSDPNQVVKNDFMGVGTALSSNFINRNAVGTTDRGLRYLCNKATNVIFDISVTGNSTLDGGIDIQQLTMPPGIVAVASAGNKLGGGWNMFNQQQYIGYAYKDAIENPVAWTGFGSTALSSYDANCVFPSTGSGPYLTYRSSLNVQQNNYTPGLNNPVHLRYAMANANVNHYLVDTQNVDHRDSLYFWISEINTAYGDLLLTSMLIRDSLIDSANSVYNAIASKYSLDSPEVVDFIYGRDFMDILISLRNSNRTIEELDSNEIASLENIRSNTRMWAHARSSAWLRMLRGDALTDTLLYPAVSDSALQSLTPKGVLALTEFSTGATEGCQYVELLVTSCQGSSAPEVDVRGWLINDNSGLFSASNPQQNPAGECAENVGITPGHYRLKYDDAWKRVPNGSFIVLYNKDQNCYNMPDTFKVDSNYVYWVPVGPGTNDNHLERYSGLENESSCSYCSDTGTTIYQSDSTWMNTIGLDSLFDGIQVLCPGCSPSYSVVPAFYHGLGYGTETNSLGQFQSAPVLKSGVGYGKKFVFIGAESSDLVVDTTWIVENADSAGAIPPSLGNVNQAFYSTVLDHTLSLPCCSYSQQKQKNADNPKLQGVEQSYLIKVYPNPARMALQFEFQLEKNVTVRISDVTGRVVAEKNACNASSMMFSVKDFVPGVYIYNFTGSRQTLSGKVIIGE